MTKTNETGWRERFDEEFEDDIGAGIIGLPDTSDIKDFLEHEIAAAEEKVRVEEKEIYQRKLNSGRQMYQDGHAAALRETVTTIEKYFKGLVHIPFPELTKREIIERLSATFSTSDKGENNE